MLRVMKTAVFSTKPYDRTFLSQAGEPGSHQFEFFEERLTAHTAPLAEGHQAVCAFVNDVLSPAVLDALHTRGVRFVALRCAGFNQVDLRHAAELGIRVARVPAYSPYAVAEFAMALILSLNRKTHRAYNRVRDGNFSIDGLLGFDLHGCTIGLIGTGKIGVVFARLLAGFGMKVLGSDPHPNPDFVAAGGTYEDREEVFTRSDIISLHCPLTPDTFHLINEKSIARMKKGVMLINTSRGGLVDARAVIRGLKSGRIGHLGLDVYEQEADFFYENLSETIIHDDVLQRLITFPNVLITSHQAYFTETALRNIAETTVANLEAFRSGVAMENEVTTEMWH